MLGGGATQGHWILQTVVLDMSGQDPAREELLLAELADMARLVLVGVRPVQPLAAGPAAGDDVRADQCRLPAADAGFHRGTSVPLPNLEQGQAVGVSHLFPRCTPLRLYAFCARVCRRSIVLWYETHNTDSRSAVADRTGSSCAYLDRTC